MLPVFFIVPGFSALAAFQVDPTSFVEVLSRDFGAPPKRLHGKPFCALLEFAILVLPPLTAGDGELRDDRALRGVLQLGITAEIADYQDFLLGFFFLGLN